MKIFKDVQDAAPSGCSGMGQYVNETDRVIQLNAEGDYLGPAEVVICFESSHVQRAVHHGWLAAVGFSSVAKEDVSEDAKNVKKTKKTETVTESVEPAVEEVIPIDAVEEDSVVATESVDI
jgi:hypothetical protein